MATTPPFLEENTEPPKRRKPIGLWIVAGLCIGGCVCPFLLGALFLPVFARARQQAICFQHLATIGTAIRRYQRKHGVFPKTMIEAISDAGIADSNNLHCPDSGEPGPGMGYAYNAEVFAGHSPDHLNPNDLVQPLLIEVREVEPNEALTKTSMFSTRHGHFVNADFFGKGPMRLDLNPDQLRQPILTIKNLASFEKEPTSVTN